MASQCPLCFAQRAEIEKVGKSYQLHMDHDHNFWKYNSYICYLWLKNKDDLTGQEGKIWRLYQSRSTQWIPQARSLEQVEAEEAEAKREERIVQLQSSVDESISLMKVIKEKLEKIEKALPDAKPAQ